MSNLGWYYVGEAQYHNGIQLRKTIIACTVCIVLGMLASVGIWYRLEHTMPNVTSNAVQSTNQADRPGDACHPNGIFGGRFNCQ